MVAYALNTSNPIMAMNIPAAASEATTAIKYGSNDLKIVGWVFVAVVILYLRLVAAHHTSDFILFKSAAVKDTYQLTTIHYRNSIAQQ